MLTQENKKEKRNTGSRKGKKINNDRNTSTMISEIKIKTWKEDRNEWRQEWHRRLLKRVRKIKNIHQPWGWRGPAASGKNDRQCLTSLVSFPAHTLVPSTHPWRAALSYRVTHITQAALQQVTWPCFAPPRTIKLSCNFSAIINQPFIDRHRSVLFCPKSATWVTRLATKSKDNNLQELMQWPMNEYLKFNPAIRNTIRRFEGCLSLSLIRQSYWKSQSYAQSTMSDTCFSDVNQ